jgi:protein required for attachment to host cells
MRVRVIVADQGEARFYDLSGMDAQLQPVGKLTDPEAQAREPAPDRAARSGDRAVAVEAGRRVALNHQSAGADPQPRKDAAMRFARQVAAELDAARRKDSFDRLVLVAGPAFIGLLRSALTQPVRATLVAEVRKDLIAQADTVVHAYLPPETFK